MSENQPQAEVSNKSLYVGNLKFETTEQQVRELFEKYGELTNCRLVTRRDGKSKGFGFVDFKNAEDAQKAIAELNDKEVDGRPILVKLAMPPKPHDDNKKDTERRAPRPRREGKTGSRA